jgi:1,4-alpha-glucan branching enzyme
MIQKKYSADKKSCNVTFTLPVGVETESACLCGDFNNWDLESTPMKKNEDGTLSATIKLETGKEYKFRYCVDNSRWENDPDADTQIPNPFGSEDSVIKV